MKRRLSFTSATLLSTTVLQARRVRFIITHLNDIVLPPLLAKPWVLAKYSMEKMSSSCPEGIL